jgi:hypothetical protein
MEPQGVTPKAFSELYPRLYHMAHEEAWEQIQRFGLLSTTSILKLWEVKVQWVAHYNRGRPHASLGPGVPDSGSRPRPRPSNHRHELPANCRIRARGVLGGLHHEYWLDETAA